MQMIVNDLADTGREYARRYVYLATGGTNPEDGILTVTETTGIKKVRTVVRKYAVEEDHRTFGFPRRVFLLAKWEHCGDLDTAKGQAGEARTGEVYRVAVADSGGFTSCSCKAGATKGPRCLHRDAMAQVIADGLDDPRESGCDRVTDSREWDDQPEPFESDVW